MTAQKVRRLRYHPPAPVIICPSCKAGYTSVYAGGKWLMACRDADGWRIGDRVGGDLRKLAMEVAG